MGVLRMYCCSASRSVLVVTGWGLVVLRYRPSYRPRSWVWNDVLLCFLVYRIDPCKKTEGRREEKRGEDEMVWYRYRGEREIYLEESDVVYSRIVSASMLDL